MKMEIKLGAPGMTSLHKAGLAGLYMTLKTFEETGKRIAGLQWALEPTQVTLDWQGDTPKAAFEELVKKSFWIDDEGFIRLTGLESSAPFRPEQKHHLYEALLSSFIQHGQHRSKGSKRALAYQVDNQVYYWVKEFEPITKIIHRHSSDIFFNKKAQFNDTIKAAGWLYPGGGKRHVVHEETTLNESKEFGLALLFAPVGVIYYTIQSRAGGRKARLAMLVPEINDLETYAQIRRVLARQGVLDMMASSASDAALRMMLAIETNRAANQLAASFGSSFLCRVITFGIVPWNEKQKSRTYTRSVVSGRLGGFENYRLAASIFKNRWQKIEAKRDRKGKETEPERYFVTTFSAREFIADNIAQGRAWYHDLATFMSQKDVREQLWYERKEMNQMVEQAKYDDESERLFIRVCHESWRRRLGKLGERATRESASFSSLVKKEAEKLRTSLARSKNAETLRETVVDFWARGGTNEALQGDGLAKLLPLFDEKNWRKARDLALLALISYKPQTEEEKNALQSSEGDEN